MDWATVIGVVFSGSFLAAIAFLIYKSGKDAVLKSSAEKSLKVKDAQLKAMAAKPSASDRLRDGSF